MLIKMLIKMLINMLNASAFLTSPVFGFSVGTHLSDGACRNPGEMALEAVTAPPRVGILGKRPFSSSGFRPWGARPIREVIDGRMLRFRNDRRAIGESLG